MYVKLTRSLTTLALALATTALVGCGDDDGAVPDAGPTGDDAGMLDAGLDAGPADAGPPDAGPPDAGPPSPLEMSRDEARTAVGEAGTALAMIPEAMRLDAEFLELDVTFARLDAVIGEKSTSLIELAGVIGEKVLRPASLPINAIPALIVARQVARAARDIDAQLVRTDWARSTDPMLVALATRLAAASTALAMLSETMWDRYREIVDSVDISTFPEDEEYADSRSILLPGEVVEVQAIVEGRDVTDATATISVNCPSAPPFEVRVVDEERGTELVARTTGSTEIWVVGVPAETPSSVRVELFGMPGETAWPTCEVNVSGHRHWRGAEIAIDSGETSTLGLLQMDWIDAALAIDSALASIVSSGTLEEQAIALEVQAYVAELSATGGAWRGFRTSWHEDDYEVFDLTLSRVLDPMGETLATSPQLASATFDTVRTQLAQLRMVEDTARQTLAPTHTGM